MKLLELLAAELQRPRCSRLEEEPLARSTTAEKFIINLENPLP